MHRPKKTVRAGIVGARFAASFHYDAIQRVYGAHTDVVGVVSNTPDRAAAFAEARGIKAFASLDAMLAEKGLAIAARCRTTTRSDSTC